MAPAAPPASEGWQRDEDAGRTKAVSSCSIFEGRKNEGGWFTAPRMVGSRLLSLRA